jgi:hypothetical protein
MATGVFRPDVAEAAARALAANARAGNVSTLSPVNSVSLQNQLRNVDWAGLARLANASVAPQPSYTPSNVQGGRGTAVNTVGQPGGIRPGTTAPTPSASTMTPYGPQLRYGAGGINEIGSSGVTPIGFAPIGSTAEQALRDAGLTSAVWNANNTVGTSSPGRRDDTSGGDTGGNGGNGGNGGTGSTGGGTGGAGGGTGGVGGGATTAPVDTTVSDLLAALAESTALAREQITGAGKTLAEQLAATDPMAQFQWNPASVTIPEAVLADYVQAIGGSPSEVQATQQLGQELLNAFMSDVGQVSQGATTAAQNWRQRQQDVGAQLTADALRQLAFNEQAQKMAIQRSEADRAQALQNQALQLLLQYATAKSGNGSLNVTAPTLPFNTVTIPGIGNITINPSTLAGLGL